VDLAAIWKDFLFRPEQARIPVGVLSGGERARLILARAFACPSNLLVRDEPGTCSNRRLGHRRIPSIKAKTKSPSPRRPPSGSSVPSFGGTVTSVADDR
jgi:ABC-type molybdenum transport system ATPase subunit/photorepair protein PhrA